MHPLLRATSVMSLFVLAFASLYFRRPTDFAIFYVGALIYAALTGRQRT